MKTIVVHHIRVTNYVWSVGERFLAWRGQYGALYQYHYSRMDVFEFFKRIPVHEPT